MLRKSLIAISAASILLGSAPSLARPTGGIWDKAPRVKRVKKPKPVVQTEQAPATQTAQTPGAAPNAAGATGAAAAPNAAAAASTAQASPAVCTADNPC